MSRTRCRRLVLGWVAMCLQAAGSPAQTIDLQDRVGFYQWAGEAETEPGEDLLTAARRAVIRTGSRVFRFYVGSRFDYVHPLDSPNAFREDIWDGSLTPAAILEIPRYQAVLEDPTLSTIILTVYAVADSGAGPSELSLTRPWGKREEGIVRRQMTELCEHLYQRYGDQPKTIIVANSEADEKLLEVLNYTDNPELALENLYHWNQTRFAAVDAVRAKHAEAELRIFYAFEISLVNLRAVKRSGAYIKSRAAALRNARFSWNALDDLVPWLTFDLLSYSAYETVNAPWRTGDLHAPPGEIQVRLRRDLEKIQRLGRGSVSLTGRRHFGDEWIMLGEVGLARETVERLPSGGVLPRLYHTLHAAIEWGCPYVVIWQVFDSPRSGLEPVGFGLLDRRGQAPRLFGPIGACRSLQSCLQRMFAGGLDAWGAGGPSHREPQPVR